MDEILNLIESVFEEFPSYFCQEITGKILAVWHFWHVSVTYSVSFTKIFCIPLPHQLKVFFGIYHGIQFSCI